MKIELAFNYTLGIHDCKLDSLVSAFQKMISPLLSAFIATVLRQFADQLFGNMATDRSTEVKQSIPCSECGEHSFIWKTHASKTVTAKVVTCLGIATLPQMQVQCKKCGHKQYIVRPLLELLPYARLSEQTERQFALCGSLCRRRVCMAGICRFDVTGYLLLFWLFFRLFLTISRIFFLPSMLFS